MDSNKKTIWIINQYASTPETGMGGRHYYLAKELAKLGHNISLIAANNTHLLREPTQIKGQYKVTTEQGFKFVWLKTCKYNNAHDKRRVWNWFWFSWQLKKVPRILPDKPDVILYSSPSLIPYLGVCRLARMFGAKLVFDVRDLWPLTIVEIGGYSPKHPMIRFMQWIEDRAYAEADFVISNLSNSIEHMLSRGLSPEKFHWISNGINLEEATNSEPLPEQVERLLPKDSFVVGYVGTLGEVNAIDVLLDAAHVLANERNISFVIVGHGKQKKALIRKCQMLGLENVIFVDAIAKKYVQSMLHNFNICYLGWKNKPIYRFGVSPNKLPEYLFSGVPVLHSFSGYGDVVMEARAGITVPANDKNAVVRAILQFMNMTEGEINQLGENGRRYVLENYDYAKLAEKLGEIIIE